MPPRNTKPRRIAEFGDFQTPTALAEKVCAALAATGFSPQSIVEPTCGRGSFLVAAMKHFPGVRKALAVEINPDYAQTTSELLHEFHLASRTEVVCDSFFTTDWPTRLRELPDPILVIGNPPWVTNAELGTLQSTNLPVKRNFQGNSGLAALTGKSNFDISEWMMIHLLKWLQGRSAALAMLCKTAVARKVLAYSWTTEMPISRADIFLIDAVEHFDAAVDACLLLCRTEGDDASRDCHVHADLKARSTSHIIGFRDAQLVADVALFDRWKHLQGSPRAAWRSGVKHDCSAVMELRALGDGYLNGLGEVVDLEDTFLYPMLKSSDLANGDVDTPSRYMIVTQSTVGQDTKFIAEKAPRTWSYLQRHAARLDRRASSIYRKRPRFSVFGVGPYTFAPWKVAISGFYKSLNFKVIGPVVGKPIVLDDTSNFLACGSEAEANYLASILNSTAASEFYRAFIFWDNKRPVTIDLLNRLDLYALARELGNESEIVHYLAGKPTPVNKNRVDLQQCELFAPHCRADEPQRSPMHSHSATAPPSIGSSINTKCPPTNVAASPATPTAPTTSNTSSASSAKSSASPSKPSRS